MARAPSPICGARMLPGSRGLFDSEFIQAAASDFEARPLLRRSTRNRRERAPDTGPRLVPSPIANCGRERSVFGFSPLVWAN